MRKALVSCSLFGAVIAASALVTARAAACGPCTCLGELGVQIIPTAAQVPENAVFFVWLPGRELDGIHLSRVEKGNRTDVDIAVEPADAPDMFELRPVQPLVPDAHYELVVPNVGGGGMRSYTVRAGVDTTPPSLGAVGLADYDPTAGYCGDKVSAALRVQDVVDDGTGSADPWLVRIEVEGASHPVYAEAAHDGTVAIGHALDRVNFADCFGSAELGAIAAGQADARISVIDRAGNRSETRELTSLKLTQGAAPDCPSDGDGLFTDCSVTAPGNAEASGTAWSIGLCLAWMACRSARRRR